MIGSVGQEENWERKHLWGGLRGFSGFPGGLHVNRVRRGGKSRMVGGQSWGKRNPLIGCLTGGGKWCYEGRRRGLNAGVAGLKK